VKFQNAWFHRFESESFSCHDLQKGFDVLFFAQLIFDVLNYLLFCGITATWLRGQNLINRFLLKIIDALLRISKKMAT
jgi:hypothetical protein